MAASQQPAAGRAGRVVSAVSRRLVASATAVALLIAATAAAVSLGSPEGHHAPAMPARGGVSAGDVSAHAGRAAARLGHGGATNSRVPGPSGSAVPTDAQRQAAARLQSLAQASRCGGRAPAEQLITHRRWLSAVIVTEYYPAPERWFTGRLVPTPGMSGRHHVDWLYSARGLSMQGDGLDGAGRLAHIAALGGVGWVNAAGAATVPPHCGIRWSQGPPAWRAGGWRNHAGWVTYPLSGGGWSRGRGHWVGDYGGATFASGPSLPVRFYHSVAVDPRLIPEGSRIYLPAYRTVNGGWFVAQDTGGAILGRHIDVYRPPPDQPFANGRLTLDAHAYVIPPGA